MACRGCSSGDGCSCSVTGDGAIITVVGSGTPVTDPYEIAFNGAEWMDSLTENTAACDTLVTPLIPVLLGDGSAVLRALPCLTDGNDGQPGGDTFLFTFDGATITDADPGTGYAKFNSLTMASVTQIYVSTQETNATDITAWLDSLSAGRIRCFLVSDPSVWIDFTITAVTTATNYRKLTVTYVDNNGTFTNGLGDFALSYAPGGSTGATGATGATGPAGGVSFKYTYSTTTTDADPGSGVLRLNNATMSSVTQIYIDLLEAAAATDLTDFLDSLDDSTNTVKGTIKLGSISDQSKWVSFSLTSVTTVAGYRKLNVSYVDHAGALTTTAADTMFSFNRAGDAGVIAPQTVRTESGTSYTLVLADAEKWINVGSGGTTTITVPTNASVAFSVGTHIDFWNESANTVSFAAAGGVTIRSEAGALNLATQYTAASLVKLATDTWALVGKLT